MNPFLQVVAPLGIASVVFVLTFRLIARSPYPKRPQASRPQGGKESPSLAMRFEHWRQERALQVRVERAVEMLPQALEIAVQALKTGQTVPQTLEVLSQESSQPLKEEFALMCREMGLGADAEQALEGFARRLPSPETSRFLESYRLSRKTGANLTHLLQTLLEGMEERQRLMRRMEAMTAQARLSGILMGSLPVLLLAVLVIMDPVLVEPLFTTVPGWGILGVAALLETAGFLWIRSLMTVKTA